MLLIISLSPFILLIAKCEHCKPPCLYISYRSNDISIFILFLSLSKIVHPAHNLRQAKIEPSGKYRFCPPLQTTNKTESYYLFRHTAHSNMLFIAHPSSTSMVFLPQPYHWQSIYFSLAANFLNITQVIKQFFYSPFDFAFCIFKRSISTLRQLLSLVQKDANEYLAAMPPLLPKIRMSLMRCVAQIYHAYNFIISRVSLE